jgi:LPS-assembly protein
MAPQRLTTGACRACQQAMLAFAIALLVLAAGIAAPSAEAQTLSEMMQRRVAQGEGNGKMLVEAKELIYNKDNDTVTASGEVQIYYQGKVLQADKVIYDRKTRRLFAEGNAKLTEPDGTVTYGSRIELSEDFRNGFVESLTAITREHTRLTAPRGERVEGEQTVLERATYTACAPCADHPEKPPLWQIRAERIIHNNQEQTIYFENATLEFLGIPFAWVPFLSTPDPSVKERSGVLTPHYVYQSYLGYGIGIPIYWGMAPNYDLTVTPTFLTRQGLLTSAEFRQRLMYGSYSIRAVGIFEADPKAFAVPPYGAANKDFRGGLQSNGQFFLSDKWSVGWDAALWTDKYFPNDYNYRVDNIIADYFRESISTVYLKGQGDRGYFDLRGYYFQGLDPHDIQRQLPLAAPVLDYNKTFDVPQDQTHGIGGQLTLDFNANHISRNLADYQSIPIQMLDPTFGLFDICSVYTPKNCLIRGIGGDYDRASGQVSWQRNVTDPFGGLWQPFAFMRLDGVAASLDKTSVDVIGATTLSNANQSNFFGPGNNISQARAMPGIGVEYRLPLIAQESWGSQVFEPIAQVIVRPNEHASSQTINEDAQSLVFDDTTLFEWNKFSGYDRVEGGTRLNAGAQYTLNFNSGAYANALVGQSFQLAGRNSYTIADDANVGLDSGLDRPQSYYVTRFSFVPTSDYSFVAKANFDNDNFALKRIDFLANMNFGHLNASLLYSRYAAQPDIGFYVPRQGLNFTTKYNVTEHYFINGNVDFDMSRHYYDPLLHTQTPLFSPAAYGFGVGYSDDCTTFSINYSSGYQYGNGTLVRSQSILAQLTLRTLGSISLSQPIASQSTPDGVGTSSASVGNIGTD